ncbi:MAG: PqqD family protein [Clostridia bacterium]|nr:PqqD family protein [Clostridia bacterium]
MKLKSDFMYQRVGDDHFLMPLNEKDFSSVIRGNETLAVILRSLEEETSEERIVDALLDQYSVSREQAAADVGGVLSVLREVHALDEE